MVTLLRLSGCPSSILAGRAGVRQHRELSVHRSPRLWLEASRRSPLAGRRSEPQSLAVPKLSLGSTEPGWPGRAGGHRRGWMPGFLPSPRPRLSQAGFHLRAPEGRQPGLLPFEASFNTTTPQFPTPGSPPGQALSSSPGRTWLPAPRLPSPIHSLRAGRRQGSCCGPGCSTPPPWGCGRGSCRSLLRRWKRDFRRGSTRAPLLRQYWNP